MPTAKVKRIITNQYYRDQGVRVLAGLAGAITRIYIKPKTPMDTGFLRSTLGSAARLRADGNIIMVWYANAPYASYLEEQPRAGSLVNFTTPGTRAPYLEPGVREGIAALMKGAVGVGGVPGVPGIGILGDP